VGADGILRLDLRMRAYYWNADGTLERVEEIPDPPQMPLEGTPLAATLNAVLGLWTLQQAADIAQLPAEALVAEAEAWAVAGEQ
jgi:hypothetical protein